jgi:hypothetical protein
LKKLKIKKIDFIYIAVIFVTIASLFSSVSLIGSSNAGGEADDLKTAALGFMILRLESQTQASIELVQAQTYLTQAGMYYAEADSENDKETKSYLIDLGNQSIEMSNYHASVAVEAENRTQNYIENFSTSLERATKLGNLASQRTTSALIFTISAIVASVVGIFKREEILYVFFPIFLIAIYYLVMSIVSTL